jgi:lipopolysaccharide export system protein LptA
MSRLLLLNLIAFSLLWTGGIQPLHALSTDKNQDIEIESNSAYLDDTTNVSVYNGNVVVVQGSMRITGDKMTIFYTDENDLEKIIVEGKPATFRQLPDNSEIYDEAEALIMEYYETQNLIILDGSARVKQGERRLIADHVEYDTELSQVRAKSDQSASGGNNGDATNEDSRVKLIIPGKRDEPAPEN